MKRRIGVNIAALSVLIVGLIAVTVYFSRASRASRQEALVTITNETESLQVISSKVENNRLVLSIKNIGNQAIIAYHFDMKAREGLSGNAETTGELAPGSQFSVMIPLNQLEQDEQTGLYKFNIAMALFTDGSAEGNWTHAQNYRERVAGAALAAQRIQEKIARLDSSDVSTMGTLAGDLKTLFMSPPQKLTRWQRIGYGEAIIGARGQVEVMVRQQQSSDKIEKGIIELRKSAERQAVLGRNVVEGK